MELLATEFPDIKIVSLQDLCVDEELSWQHFLINQTDQLICRCANSEMKGKIVFITWIDSGVQGCVFQDDSLMWQTHAMGSFWNITKESRLISFHPVYNTTAEQVLAFHLPVVTGCSVAFVKWNSLLPSVESDHPGNTIFDLLMCCLPHEKPTVLVSTPVVWAKLVKLPSFVS